MGLLTCLSLTFRCTFHCTLRDLDSQMHKTTAEWDALFQTLQAADSAVSAPPPPPTAAFALCVSTAFAAKDTAFALCLHRIRGERHCLCLVFSTAHCRIAGQGKAVKTHCRVAAPTAPRFSWLL